MKSYIRMYTLLLLFVFILNVIQCVPYTPRLFGNTDNSNVRVVFDAPINTNVLMHYTINNHDNTVQLFPITDTQLTDNVVLQYDINNQLIHNLPLNTDLYTNTNVQQSYYNDHIIPYTHLNTIDVGNTGTLTYSLTYQSLNKENGFVVHTPVYRCVAFIYNSFYRMHTNFDYIIFIQCNNTT